jgi:hypothetical protein
VEKHSLVTVRKLLLRKHVQDLSRVSSKSIPAVTPSRLQYHKTFTEIYARFDVVSLPETLNEEKEL